MRYGEKCAKMMRGSERLYHYYNNIDHALILLKHGLVWFSSFRHLNDPFEHVIPVFQQANERGKHVQLSEPKLRSKREVLAGIFCLSRENDNFQMWSHYANRHAGVCIGFDLRKCFVSRRGNYYHYDSDGKDVDWVEVEYNIQNEFVLADT